MPVEIDARALGRAGPSCFETARGAPRMDTYHPSAHTKALALPGVSHSHQATVMGGDCSCPLAGAGFAVITSPGVEAPWLTSSIELPQKV